MAGGKERNWSESDERGESVYKMKKGFGRDNKIIYYTDQCESRTGGRGKEAEQLRKIAAR